MGIKENISTVFNQTATQRDLDPSQGKVIAVNSLPSIMDANKRMLAVNRLADIFYRNRLTDNGRLLTFRPLVAEPEVEDYAGQAPGILKETAYALREALAARHDVASRVNEDPLIVPSNASRGNPVPLYAALAEGLKETREHVKPVEVSKRDPGAATGLVLIARFAMLKPMLESQGVTRDDLSGVNAIELHTTGRLASENRWASLMPDASDYDLTPQADGIDHRAGRFTRQPARDRSPV